MSQTTTVSARSSKRLSFEFFPPRSEAQQRRLWRTLGWLETLAPEFLSVTWGALGSQSQASLDLLGTLVTETRVPVAAHLTCAGQTRGRMREILDQLQTLGIRHLVVLRGDAMAQPSGVANALAEDASTRRDGEGDLLQHASDLVELVAERNAGTSYTFEMSVAAYPEVHPEAANAESDLYWLARKLDSGAARAITQFFFDADTFLRWRDRAVASGIDKPLIPGILPIHDIDKVLAFSERCGATVPANTVAQFRRVPAEASETLAVDTCLALCERLAAEGVDDFHLYTLNHSNLAWKVGLELAGVDPMASLQPQRTAA